MNILTACAAGACAGASACAYQSVYKNQTAAPETLGVSPGAYFGVSLAAAFGAGSAAALTAAYIAALLALFVTSFFQKRVRIGNSPDFLLPGIVTGAFFTALAFAVRYFVATAPYREDSPVVLTVMCLSLIALSTLRRRLNVLTLGGDEAYALGVNARTARVSVIAVAALASVSAVVAFGIAASAGLFIPRLARRLVGSGFGRLVPASMLIGAFFMMLAEWVSTVAGIPAALAATLMAAPLYLLLLIGKGDKLE